MFLTSRGLCKDTPWYGARHKADQPFLFTRQPTMILHDSLIQLNECLGNGRALLHGEHTVGAKSERFIEELRKFRDVCIGVFGQWVDERHFRFLSSRGF